MMNLGMSSPANEDQLDRLIHAATEGDPLSHMRRRVAAGLRPGGYGLLLSRKLVDEVVYSHTGNEVLLVKYLD